MGKYRLLLLLARLYPSLLIKGVGNQHLGTREKDDEVSPPPEMFLSPFQIVLTAAFRVQECALDSFPLKYSYVPSMPHNQILNSHCWVAHTHTHTHTRAHSLFHTHSTTHTTHIHTHLHIMLSRSTNQETQASTFRGMHAFRSPN